MSKLKLPCIVAASDHLDVDAAVVVTSTPAVEISVAMRDDDASFDHGEDMFVEASIYLDAEHARQLFNWLGVWLHGGNRS